MGILMAAMDSTIVATSMGTIVGELGGMDKFTLVTSAYMIASLAVMPIYGKLADMYGRKRFYLAGLILFMTGSILCGSAQNMVQLFLFRGLQGLGGGALMPLAYTIIFDILPPAERGKVMGLFGAVFGLSSIFGPLLGAYLTDYVDWRWIFYINVPLGLLSLLLLTWYYHESGEHLKQALDWAGALFLVLSVVIFMVILQLGGRSYAWNSLLIIGLLVSFILFLALFIWNEIRNANPILSLDLFSEHLFAASQGVAFFYCAVFIATAVYIPIYVQGVFGGTATSAGGILAPMMLASVAGSQIGGRTAVKTSYRKLMLISCFLYFCGVLLLGTLTITTPHWLLTLFMILTGLGMGISFPVLSMASNHGLDYRHRASANSTLSFFESMGMTIGISIFGAVQSHMMLRNLRQTPGLGIMNNIEDVRILLQPGIRTQLAPDILRHMTASLAESITSVFCYSLVFIVIALFFIIMMGNARLNITEVSNSLPGGPVYPVE